VLKTPAQPAGRHFGCDTYERLPFVLNLPESWPTPVLRYRRGLVISLQASCSGKVNISTVSRFDSPINERFRRPWNELCIASSPSDLPPPIPRYLIHPAFSLSSFHTPLTRSSNSQSQSSCNPQPLSLQMLLNVFRRFVGLGRFFPGGKRGVRG